MVNFLFKSRVAKILLFIFLLLFIFWSAINLSGLKSGSLNNLYGALYPIISIIGGTYGLLVIAKRWGGVKSVIGRGIVFLSLGLYGEAFGQLTWSYYTIVRQIEIPYPSIADIGYFSIIPLYGLAMYNFAKASGVHITLRNYSGKLQAIFVPLLMVGVAYFLFLKDVEIEFSNPLRTFLDFGYPGFEAIAVSIGILTYSLSRGILGGRMKKRVLFLIFALIFQYITDYTFLYQAGVGIYYNAGLVDLMYTTSLLIMSLGILHFKDYET